MKQLISRVVITTILGGALSGVSAMNWNSIQQPPSVSGISAAKGD